MNKGDTVLDVDRLEALTEKKKSCRDIAKELGCSPTTARRQARSRGFYVIPPDRPEPESDNRRLSNSRRFVVLTQAKINRYAHRGIPTICRWCGHKLKVGQMIYSAQMTRHRRFHTMGHAECYDRMLN